MIFWYVTKHCTKLKSADLIWEPVFECWLLPQCWHLIQTTVTQFLWPCYIQEMLKRALLYPRTSVSSNCQTSDLSNKFLLRQLRTYSDNRNDENVTNGNCQTFLRSKIHLKSNIFIRKFHQLNVLSFFLIWPPTKIRKLVIVLELLLPTCIYAWESC